MSGSNFRSFLRKLRTGSELIEGSMRYVQAIGRVTEGGEQFKVLRSKFKVETGENCPCSCKAAARSKRYTVTFVQNLTAVQKF
jgi:hypothetical protein